MKSARMLIRILSLLLIPQAVQAQSVRRLTTDAWCDTHEGRPWLRRNCEVRELVLPASALAVDGGRNGSVEIRHWNRDDVLVRVRIEAQAETTEMAESLQRRIPVHASAGNISASVPSLDAEEWAGTSIRIYVPRRTDLTVRTINGNIRITGVQGKMDLRSHNGGLDLANVAGSISGETTNGGIHLILDGGTWSGNGVKLLTASGGVTAVMPADYAADLHVSTNSGAFTIHDLSLRCTPQPTASEAVRPPAAGCRSRKVRAKFNGGGPPIAIETTTGGVQLRSHPLRGTVRK